MINSFIAFLLVYFASYMAGILFAVCVNILNKQKRSNHRTFGIVGVVISAGFLVLGYLHTQQLIEAATNGSEAFAHGQAQGYGLAGIITPAVLMIVVMGLVGKQIAAPPTKGEPVVKPAKRIADGVATFIFWMIALILLCMAVNAFLARMGG